jgi:hypothetical protein
VIKVTYNTKGSHQSSKTCERFFASLEAAKNAPLPEGYVFAYIKLDEGGHWVYSATFGWKFHEKLVEGE